MGYPGLADLAGPDVLGPEEPRAGEVGEATDMEMETGRVS
jgi:hypothetical protein